VAIRLVNGGRLVRWLVGGWLIGYLEIFVATTATATTIYCGLESWESIQKTAVEKQKIEIKMNTARESRMQRQQQQQKQKRIKRVKHATPTYLPMYV